MARDIQLQSAKLDDVLEKRRLDQALNAKEFAVLAGISYSTAREWFRAAGFPVVRGVVFWADFVEWRRTENRLAPGKPEPQPKSPSVVAPTTTTGWPAKAARILAEA